MTIKKVVIIGGVAGGATAAARLRRLDEQMEIVMVERGEYISFANCGLPYHVGGSIKERRKLLLATPELMKARYNIDVRVRSEAIQIDRDARAVVINNLETGEVYRESYDHLILSPGAQPVRLPIPGIDLPSVLSLRNIPDMDRIIERANQTPNGRAVVVGGGFIGVEMAENLRERGFAVTLVEAAEQVMTPIDRELAAIVHEQMRAHGVLLRLGEMVASFTEEGGETLVHLKSGGVIRTDLVILATGVRPEVKLAQEAGLELGPRGGVKVNAQLLSSDPHISVIGDAAEVPAFGGAGQTWVPLAGPANRQARLVADRIAGLPITFTGVQGTSIAKVFDLTVAATGKNEATLKREGTPFHSVVTTSNSNASYYPGAQPLTLKLLFSPDGKILGAQAVGGKGVDKRMDVLATAMRLGGTVDDLAALELAYAPPYSSAKDPVNILGYVAGNLLRGETRFVDWRAVFDRDSERTVLLDVREEAEWQVDHLAGAYHIPLGELRARVGELPKEKEIFVYCAVGQRAHTAVRILQQLGYNVANIKGGFRILKAVRDDLVASGSGTADGRPEAGQRRGDGKSGDDRVAHSTQSAERPARVLRVDACGLQCPGPIMEVYNAIKGLQGGEILEVTATDPGFWGDVAAWCDRTGHRLVSREREAGVITARIQKGGGKPVREATAEADGKTMVIFSGDLDKAIASFIIANGAAAMGRPVTLFFTFWGLNILRKPTGPVPPKGLVERLFGWMMPRGSTRLGLSQMNMGGLGARMIRWLMKRKRVASLEELIAQAQANGVRLVACQMSMDLMGITQDELIDGVEVGGVASMLAAAEASNMSLFI
jgi:NADPH-dependent 2,4-dienoyl-CoA reductase/sulfur reductase-like enzyme/peroxiredoxin family protein/rhodanese-related sulfurtransferase/TusA-related sulfurtransferase